MTPLRSLLVAATLVLIASPAFAQNEYAEQIELQIEAMNDLMVEDGLYPDFEMFSGTLDAGASEELELRLVAGVDYQIVAVCDTDCSDLDLVLYDSSGNSVAQDFLLNDVPIIELTVTRTGFYQLEVLMITCSAEPCYWGVQPYAADGGARGGPAGRTDQYEGDLSSGDETLGGGEYYDAYTVEVVAGQTIEVDLHSNDFDTYLAVRSPTGDAYDNDDFESSTSHSRLLIEAPESGTWDVWVTAYEKGMNGAYHLDITIAGSAGGARSAGGPRRESGRLSSGDETIGSGEYVDYYDFTGIRGEEVIVELRSADFDPYLVVIGPRDQREENDDFEGDMSRSLVRFELPVDGDYRILVTSYQPGETGAYDLSIQQGLEGTASQGVISERGTLATGDETLRSGEYVDEYTFEGRPGEHVRVDLTSTDFDTYVMLVGPGDFRHENDDADDDVGHSLVEADLADSGTYQVLVTSYQVGETGDYELQIERRDVVASEGQRDVRSLQLGRSSSGTLEPGDGELDTGEFRDLWVFDGEAGDGFTIELTSADFDTYVLLVSPDGDVIDENDDADGRTDISRVVATLPQDGRYRVVATTYRAGETGNYEVTLSAGPNAASTTRPGGGARSSSGNVYGIFVGVSDYGGRANNLAYTADDAIRAADAIVQGGGMSPDNAIVLTDREATVANVRAAFRDMGRRVGPDDTFVYFYSGHGDRVPRNGPERSDPDALDETIELYDEAIRDNEMGDLLGLIDARVSLMILDSCFSGGFSKDVISVPGRMGFFSSEEDVTSQVAAKFRAGGYLSQFLFDGVGERLADSDGDGAISAIELSQYIHERYRADVKSGGMDDYVRTSGPQSGFQHFVVDRGSIAPNDIIFR